MQYFLAIDIGASSGRHILSWLEDGKLRTEEVHRFDNQIREEGKSLFWDTDALIHEITEGLRKCHEIGKIPISLGIDTWGVDYLLLDPGGSTLSEAYCYRDQRTEGLPEEIDKKISFSDLYQRVGIQRLPFNTIYQLSADVRDRPHILDEAEQLLMVPSYFNYALTGVMMNEYSDASTTALLNVETRDWDWDLIRLLNLPEQIFTVIKEPGTTVGTLLPEIQERVGFDCEVVLPPTHDTGSAYLAVPSKDPDAVYLSSGTWSLLGIESPKPYLTSAAREAGFTNEGGYGKQYRFLKNIMGLWMIQSIRKELDPKPSFAEMESMARETGEAPVLIDVNDARFIAPKRMILAVKDACLEQGLDIGDDTGVLLAVVYHSLADFYRQSILQLEAITGRTYTSLNIVGGGSKDDYLNELTAKACGIPIYAGPSEGTVIGNILSQMLARQVISNVAEARKLVRKSFEIKKFV